MICVFRCGISHMRGKGCLVSWSVGRFEVGVLECWSGSCGGLDWKCCTKTTRFWLNFRYVSEVDPQCQA